FRIFFSEGVISGGSFLWMDHQITFLSQSRWIFTIESRGFLAMRSENPKMSQIATVLFIMIYLPTYFPKEENGIGF
ncbi:MAG: hypothetical protein WAV05_14800, partial [Anaerolineales bacterium]